MRAATEEFLYVLLWTADSMLRPSWRDVADPAGFETWAWRNGLGRRIAELERRKLIESRPELSTERVVRLTAAGRLTLLGGRDPAARWAREWDGKWRLLMFDVQTEESALRTKLRRLLQAEHFGYLQNSVWITPDSLAEAHRIMNAAPANPEGFLLFEGRPASGESDEALVRAAWDFDAINRGYEEHLDVLRQCPRGVARDAAGFARLQAWARREQAAWRRAIKVDPMLPQALSPKDYLGRQAWRARGEVFARLAKAR